jgi:hypothetical protein
MVRRAVAPWRTSFKGVRIWRWPRPEYPRVDLEARLIMRSSPDVLGHGTALEYERHHGEGGRCRQVR